MSSIDINDAFLINIYVLIVCFIKSSQSKKSDCIMQDELDGFKSNVQKMCSNWVLYICMTWNMNSRCWTILSKIMMFSIFSVIGTEGIVARVQNVK